MAGDDAAGSGGGEASEPTRSITQSVIGKPGVLASEDALFEPGTQLGRYVIVRQVGAGGMSLVYEAYDREFDRRLAIKVMRSKHWDQAGQQRALREGQALAKLSHPNVVAVHDVGAFGDQTFIAMEIIDGITLKQWLRGGARTWRAIVDVLLQAGRGIAAAHAAGLVHRDIKPGNVLIDASGRARVTDFGIARPVHKTGDTSTTAEDPPVVADSSSDSWSGRSLLDAQITRTGAVMGTPAYMAPEQREGKSDALADQYSFCLIAQQALVGVPNDASFPGASGGAPRWLRQAIERGLDDDPAARYPSMRELLVAMTADPTGRRVRIAAFAVGAVLVASTAVAIATRPEPAAPCGGSEALAGEAWNDTLASQARRAFVASGRSYAADTFARVDELLSARRTAWAGKRREICEATRVRGEQSEHLLDLRMQCMDRRLGELKALTSVLATQADAEVVDHAIGAVRAQTELSACDDVTALTQALPRPDDPTVRAADDRVSGDLDKAAALAAAGKYQDALRAISKVADEAKRVGSVHTQARALYWLGHMQSFDGQSAESEATLERAMPLAAEARDDALIADIGLELIYVIGYDLARPDEALQTGDLVTAMVRRAGTDRLREGKLLDRIGVIWWAKRSFTEAQRHFERALAVYGNAADADELIAASLTNLGNVLADQGKYEEAREQYEREIAITERVHGVGHPQTARALANLGTVLTSLKRYDEAQRTFERALAIWEAAYGPEHAMVAMVLTNLGDMYLERGDPARGLPYCRRAQEIGEATLPENHPIRAYHLICVGSALQALGRSREAQTTYERALAIRTAAGTDATELAEVKLALAKARWDAGTGPARRETRDLASAAREAFAAAGEQHRPQVGEIDDWLRTHR